MRISALLGACTNSTSSQKEMADPTRFERATFAFGGRRSIQLSYGSLRMPDTAIQTGAEAPAAAVVSELP